LSFGRHSSDQPRRARAAGSRPMIIGLVAVLALGPAQAPQAIDQQFKPGDARTRLQILNDIAASHSRIPVDAVIALVREAERDSSANVRTTGGHVKLSWQEAEEVLRRALTDRAFGPAARGQLATLESLRDRDPDPSVRAVAESAIRAIRQ